MVNKLLLKQFFCQILLMSQSNFELLKIISITIDNEMIIKNKNEKESII
jgi:hypothetical protein